jgi:hypothetical protein
LPTVVNQPIVSPARRLAARAPNGVEVSICTVDYSS